MSLRVTRGVPHRDFIVICYTPVAPLGLLEFGQSTGRDSEKISIAFPTRSLDLLQGICSCPIHPNYPSEVVMRDGTGPVPYIHRGICSDYKPFFNFDQVVESLPPGSTARKTPFALLRT